MVDGKDDYGVVLVRGPSRQIRGWFRSLEHRLKVSYCRFNVIDLADHEFIETYLTVVNRLNNPAGNIDLSSSNGNEIFKMSRAMSLCLRFDTW